MKPMGFPGSGTNCKCQYCKRKSSDKGMYNRIGRSREKESVTNEIDETAQAEGHDDNASSLVCPVVMSADTLRKITAK